jgi:hypothetical protein
MLSEKPWRPELLLRFFGVILLSYSLGTLLVALLTSSRSPLRPVSDYVMLIGGTLSFHGVVLALLPGLLREHGSSSSAAFGFGNPRRLRALIGGVAGGVACFPFIVLLGEFFSYLLQWLGIQTESQAPVQMLQRNPTLPFQTLSFLMAVVMAPVAEEVVFRGILYPSMKQLGFPRAALWATSILFGAIHLNWMTFVPLTVFSILLTLLYERTDNLMSCIAMHGVFNLINFLRIAFESPL